MARKKKRFNEYEISERLKLMKEEPLLNKLIRKIKNSNPYKIEREILKKQEELNKLNEEVKLKNKLKSIEGEIEQRKKQLNNYNIETIKNSVKKATNNKKEYCKNCYLKKDELFNYKNIKLCSSCYDLVKQRKG